MNAIIVEGRWVSEDGTPLDPVQMNQVHNQFNRIHAFTKDVVPLTHDRITILTNILHVTPKQEQAILNILKLDDKQIEELLK